MKIFSTPVLLEFPQIISREVVNMQPSWYVLRTKTGHEDRVRSRLENKTECLGVLLPKMEVMVTRSGKKKRLLKPLFPGYIFVQMELRDEFRYEVKNTPGVINFLASGNTPIPVGENEIEDIMSLMDGTETTVVRPDFEVGDNVKIVAGPFMGQTGIINAIDSKRNRFKVIIEIFGKQIPIELAHYDIETE